VKLGPQSVVHKPSVLFVVPGAILEYNIIIPPFLNPKVGGGGTLTDQGVASHVRFPVDLVLFGRF
jgi:hypothetical protein